MKHASFRASLTLTTLALAALATVPACSGSGGSTADVQATGDFLVLKTEPTNGGTIYLNDPIAIDFSQPVDLDSASLSTVTFEALDQQGIPVPSELVTGSFRVSTSPGDTDAGRRLLFVPKLPSNNDYSNGGFRAGRTYLVSLVGGNQVNGTVLRNTQGKGLREPVTFRFATRDGTQPAQLFRNPKPGGPTRAGLEITTATNLTEVPLGLFGAPPLEVRLRFDQALNPNDANVPVSFDSNPLVRDQSKRGKVFLEYDDLDRVTNFETVTWIPADVDLEENGLEGSVLALRPVGVLPNAATIRIIVENSLEDIAGESNIADPSYDRIFGQFRTQDAYEQQWNGIAESFETTDSIDFGAPFPQGQAEVGPGYIKAGFAFEGRTTTSDYQPTANEVVLNTGFTQIVPTTGQPFSVSGGVFNFRNVTIPQGVSVVGQGPNPMVWLCSGRFTVSGILSVDGGPGARVDTLNSANFAKAGGVGVCGGGNGGDGTPSATQRDLRGGTGRGPLQEGGKGGGGGYLACTSGCYTGTQYNGSGGGSGGGGGTLATQGDPNWRGTSPTLPIVPNVSPPVTNTAFQQKLGYGGSGCSGTSGMRTQFLAGGEPGVKVFTDSRGDNNFWGSAVDVNRNIRVTGELSIPLGGGGGGGGGDNSYTNNCTLTGNTPANDASAGGGGGGAGVLIVKALGEIEVTSTGTIRANGGNGGGGEQVGSCGEAGGGGAGAGGMVVLMSATGIILHAHGSPSTNRYVYGAPVTPAPPFLGNDYDFAVSADGGVCTTGGFGAINVQSKYPANGAQMIAGTSYDGDPLGGLGGMGIVQLMVPPGDNSDGTNTRLDDNITFKRILASGVPAPVSAEGKQQLLGWRGFPNMAGTAFFDDAHNPITLGDNEGDIRPSPTLLPVPFNAQSRARSKWIDTGVSQRDLIATASGPRGLLDANGAVVGPRFEFAGLDPTKPGYVHYSPVGQSAVRIEYPLVISSVAIASKEGNASYLGKPAYRITLGQPALGEANRYVQYEAELLTAGGGLLTSLRIMSHTDRELLLDATDDLLPNDAERLQVRAKFFKIITNSSEGLGPAFTPVGATEPTPIANLRFGFAFHSDPTPGPGPGSPPAGTRFPTDEQEFVRDMNDPLLIDWINRPVSAGGLGGVPPRYIQWDVLFDLAFSSKPLAADVPLPELHFLRVPFRF